MIDHFHNWAPIPGEHGRYSCSSCGALGSRRYDGQIRQYAKAPHRDGQVTARPIGDGNGVVPARDPKIGWER